jgi:hypothetical protein
LILAYDMGTVKAACHDPHRWRRKHRRLRRIEPHRQAKRAVHRRRQPVGGAFAAGIIMLKIEIERTGAYCAAFSGWK